MTVLNPTRRATFAGNGSTVLFALPNTLRIFQPSDLVVRLDGDPPLIIGTHYSVTGANTPQAAVVMVTPPPSGRQLIVERALPASQQANITNLGAFYPEVHEDALDRLTLYAADVADDVNVLADAIYEIELLPGPVGPAGPTGPTGAVGPVGPQGPVGNTGAQGLTGATGSQGPVGNTGAQGAQGAVGPQGPVGATGPTGPAGSGVVIKGTLAGGAPAPVAPVAGDMWIANGTLTGWVSAVAGDGVVWTGSAWSNVGPIRGPVGPTGATGATGAQGPAGAAGAAGATGAAGPTGPAGPVGPAGATGAQGPTGPTGATGPQGPAADTSNLMALTGNQTAAGNKTFTGQTALALGSTVDNLAIGYRDIPVAVSNANKTFALADAGKGFGKDVAAALTYTIPANASVPFPIGTALSGFNNNATGNITVSIGGTDTMFLAGTALTGNRTLGPRGQFTAWKVAATVWMISGPGLT